MTDKIKQLYDIMFSPIVTPHNLLENAKLDNYEYVNYSKRENGLLVSMKCTIESNYETTFFYYFDKEDNLQLVTMETVSGSETIFNRDEEIRKLTKRLLKSKKDALSQIAL